MKKISAGVIAPLLALMLLAASTSTLRAAEALPEMRVQLGHSYWVLCAAFSPDGRYVVTAGGDKSLKLWETKTGKEMRTFNGHLDRIRTVAFSPDGTRMLSGGNDGLLILWDVAAGTELARRKANGRILSAVFSPDGKCIVSGGTDARVSVWDPMLGRKLRSLKRHAKSVNSVSFSRDGTYLISSGDDDTLKLWDASTWKRRRTFKGHTSGATNAFLGAFTIHEHTNGIANAVFTPDGKHILSGSWDSTLRLWETATGKQLRVIQSNKTANYVAVSPDGRAAASASGRVVRFWDLETGAETSHYTIESNTIMTVAYSPDGKYIVASSEDTTARLLDAATASEVRALRGHSSSVKCCAYSPDGRTFVAGNLDYTEGARSDLKLWDAKNGKIVRTFSDRYFSPSCVAFSPDGRYFVAGSEGLGKSLLLWEAATGKLLQTYGDYQGNVRSVAFSPDGRYVLSGSGDYTVRLWETLSGRQVRQFNHDNPVNAVAFSPDGKLCAVGCCGKDLGYLVAWELAADRKLMTSVDFPDWVTSIAFAPDGRSIIAGTADAKLRIWAFTASRSSVNVLSGHSACVNSVAVSPDGKFVASGSSDGTLKVWDLAAGKDIRTFPGHLSSVTCVSFSPDGKYLLSAGFDHTSRIWDIATGHSTAFMANADGSRWIIYTDDGYWDGSSNCGDLVAMVSSLECWNIDQFAVRNNRPDLVLARLGNVDKELLAHYHGQYLKRLRKLGLTEAQLSSDYHVPNALITGTRQDGKSVELRFSLDDPKYALKRYNVYVNDVPLFGSYGREISGHRAALTERIELTAGENKVEVSCLNEKGAESYRALAYARYTDRPASDLYFIGFGVSTYRDKALNLRYAHKDALDLAALFSRMKGRFANVHAWTYVNEQATVQSIRNAKTLLRSARPDDTFILFISGHGVHDRDNESTYYFLTSEADLGHLSRTAANFDAIEDILQGIPPRNKLFLMDTCESGEVDEQAGALFDAMAGGKGIRSRAITLERGIKVQKARPAARAYLYDKDRYIYNDLARRSGAVVFSSCRGGEYSYEDDRMRNGFFTHEILEALDTPNADRDRDGVISTDELRAYVTAEVAKLSADAQNPDGLQHPTVDRDNIYQKFGFPLAVTPTSGE